jgi:hypothetical protein
MRYRAECLLDHADNGVIKLSEFERETLDRIALDTREDHCEDVADLWEGPLTDAIENEGSTSK